MTLRYECKEMHVTVVRTLILFYLYGLELYHIFMLFLTT